MLRLMMVLVVGMCLLGLLGCETIGVGPTRSANAQLVNADAGDESFFPIMVWAQDPALAEQYKAIGVNVFFALFDGPTEEQLAALKASGMYTICDQNEVGLKHIDDPTIIAWMHGDEPDNKKKDYDGKAVPLEKILADYATIKENDPSRLVVVNFGQGTTNEKFSGRAIAHEQYRDYAKGADIVSYDFYPIANYKDWKLADDGTGKTVWRTDGNEKLWMVPRGIHRLREWTDYQKPVWAVLECTSISNPLGHKVTPHQLRAETWMSLIAGANGVCWFVHQFEPNPRNVAAILDDEVLKKAVNDVNREILALAPVLNSKTIEGKVEVASSNEKIPISIMVKKKNGAMYIFAVGMKNGPTVGTFTGKGLGRFSEVEVLGEDRVIKIVESAFTDQFEAYSVRQYLLR